MRPYVIHVRLREYGKVSDKIARYAVLEATAAEALEVVSGGLAFGKRASVSDETLTFDEKSELVLVSGKACMIEQGASSWRTSALMLTAALCF